MLESPNYLIGRTTTMVNVDAFMDFVAARHAGVKRRDGTDYFGHCVNVANLAGDIARTLGEDDIGVSVVRAAGAGHDLLEDTRTDFDDIAELTSDEVAAIISWVSDDKRMPGMLRHRNYVYRITMSPRRAQIVKLADICDNANDSLKLLHECTSTSTLKFLRRWQPRTLQLLHALGRIIDAPQRQLALDSLMKLRAGLDGHRVALSDRAACCDASYDGW